MNKTLLTYILIVGISGIAGTSTGIVGKRLLGQEEIDYSGFNPEDYREDGASLLASYNSNPNYARYSPAKLVSIGLEKYRQCENSYSFGTGLASTIVSQTVRNYQIKNGDKYFEESISNSDMVSLANRVTQDGKNGDIYLYLGKATSAETGTYPSEGIKYSPADYKAYLGRTLDEMFIYLISDKTTVSGSKVTKLNNGDIEVLLKLNADVAPYYYKFQMKNISNLDKLPMFSYINLTYTFSSDMLLKSLHVDEKYAASMGLTVQIVNSIDYYYFPNQEMEIPTLDTQLDYSLGGKIK